MLRLSTRAAPAGQNIETPPYKINAHPVVTRTASFFAAAAVLGCAGAFLVTMKTVLRTLPQTDEPPVIEAGVLVEPTPDTPPEAPVREPLTMPADSPWVETIGVTEMITTEPAAGSPFAGPVQRDIRQPVWLARPDGRDFEREYPRAALRSGMGARVVLDCVVGADGRIACSVLSEDPQGWRFGEAALRISQSFRMAPMSIDGQPTDGGRVRVPISFRAE